MLLPDNTNGENYSQHSHLQLPTISLLIKIFFPVASSSLSLSTTTRSRLTPTVRARSTHAIRLTPRTDKTTHAHETNPYKQQIKTIMVDKAVQKAQYEHTIKYFKKRIGEELLRIKCAQENIRLIEEGFKENLSTEEREDAYKYIANFELDIAASSMMADCLKQSHNQLQKFEKNV